MPRFYDVRPSYEARLFSGGAASALDIQGWLLSQNVQSEHVEAAGEEPEKITFFSGRELKVGDWIMWKGGTFVIMSSSTLFSNYTSQ